MTRVRQNLNDTLDKIFAIWSTRF